MATAVTVDNFKHFFNGNSPKKFIYEDDQCVVFDEEYKPQAPVHFLVVPKKVIPRLIDASIEDEKILGRLLNVARRIAKEKGLNKKGFRVVMNDGVNGHLLLVAKDVAVNKGIIGNGYHVIIDEDYRAQRFKSLHVFGRALHHMVWPTGPGCRL